MILPVIILSSARNFIESSMELALFSIEFTELKLTRTNVAEMPIMNKTTSISIKVNPFDLFL
jgi:hypothetical protein